MGGCCDGVVVGVCGVASEVYEWGVREVRDEVVVVVCCPQSVAKQLARPPLIDEAAAPPQKTDDRHGVIP
jgi:hypothetical protein